MIAEGVQQNWSDVWQQLAALLWAVTGRPIYNTKKTPVPNFTADHHAYQPHQNSRQDWNCGATSVVRVKNIFRSSMKHKNEHICPAERSYWGKLVLKTKRQNRAGQHCLSLPSKTITKSFIWLFSNLRPRWVNPSSIHRLWGAIKLSFYFFLLLLTGSLTWHGRFDAYLKAYMLFCDFANSRGTTASVCSASGPQRHMLHSNDRAGRGKQGGVNTQRQSPRWSGWMGQQSLGLKHGRLLFVCLFKSSALMVYFCATMNVP